MKIKLPTSHFPTLLMAFLIPFPVRVTGFAIFIITVAYFFYLLINKKFDFAIFRKPLVALFIVSFAMIVLGLFWGNFKNGGMNVERGLFILCFPVLFFHAAKYSSLTVSQVAISFFSGCLVVSLVGWGHAIWSTDYASLSSGHTQFTGFLDIHPTYLSVFFIFSFFFFKESLQKKYFQILPKQQAGYALAALYCFVMVFFLRSQIAMLSFVILLSVYFIIRLKKRAWLVTFILFTIVFLTYLLDTHRVSTYFDRYGKNVSTALDNRSKLWGGVLQAIKTSPVFGAGTGAEQERINEGYKTVGYTEGIANSYNAHNQYLQFWVRNGLPELICFLVLLFVLFAQALKMRSLTFLIFLMMVSMVMLTESFLSVQKGIVFFYFFACVFTLLPEEQAVRETDQRSLHKTQ